ncbi:MAG: hypothetical protein ACKPKU_28635, partial [Dolichospermum sp.]
MRAGGWGWGDFVPHNIGKCCIINETLQQPPELLRWLYENQGSQRFDTSNRLFLVLVDSNFLEDSWKLKRDFSLLKR